jgi:hypothetical protein
VNGGAGEIRSFNHDPITPRPDIQWTAHALLISTDCQSEVSDTRNETPIRLGVMVECRGQEMKRTIYSVLMSIFFGVLIGSITTDVINIMYPDFGLDYMLAIAFFIALSWSVLTLAGLILRRS